MRETLSANKGIAPEQPQPRPSAARDGDNETTLHKPPIMSKTPLRPSMAAQPVDHPLAFPSPFQQDIGPPSGDAQSPPGGGPSLGTTSSATHAPSLPSTAPMASVDWLDSLRTLPSAPSRDDPTNSTQSSAPLPNQPSTPRPPRATSLPRSMSSISRRKAPLGAAPSATPPEPSGPPPEFVCPITQELMVDPVVLETGQTYERSAIIQWLDSGDAKDPLTGQGINRAIIVPNWNLRNAIQAYKQSRASKAPLPDENLVASVSGSVSVTVPEDDAAPHGDQDPTAKATSTLAAALVTVQAPTPATLLAAAAEGDAAAVRKLVKGGERVGGADGDGDTALHVAARKGHVGVVEVLLELGAGCGVENAVGMAPFLLAAAEGHVEVLEAMLAAGADASQCDGRHRRTALHHAALTGQRAALAVLLAACPAAMVDAEDESGCTPLLLAAKFGHEGAAGQLVEAGADCLWRVERGRGLTALHYACQAGCVGMVRLMLGKRQGRSSRKEPEMAPPLLLAVQSGSEECVRLLLEAGGVEVNTVMHQGQESALGLAVRAGMEGMVRLLLDAGADAGMLRWMPLEGVPGAIMRMLLEARVGGPQLLMAPAGHSKWHPLLDAVQKGDEGLVRHLMERGCSSLVVSAILEDAVCELPLQDAGVLRELLVRGVHGDAAWRPLVVAMTRRDEEVVELLLPHVRDLDCARGGMQLLQLAVQLDDEALVRRVLAAGAGVKARGDDGRAAVHCLGKNVEVLRVLVETGADVNAEDYEGMTPLMSQNLDAAMIHALVAAGADVNVQEKTGKTALMRAKGVDAARHLVEAGADILAICHMGKSVLHYAVATGDLSKLEYLLSLEAGLLLLQGADAFVHFAAASTGSLPVVKLLLAADPSALHAREGRVQWSLLHCAAGKGSLELVRYLVEQGLAAGEPDAEGNTPLHLALEREHWAVASFLLTTNPRGFRDSPEEASKLFLLGYTDAPREFMCVLMEEAHKHLPALLYEHKLDTEDAGRLPSLHWAGYHGMALVVAAMLDAGADPNLVNEDDGRTPLHCVMPRARNYTDVAPPAMCVRLLLGAGAKLDAQDIKGQTPLHKAILLGSHILGDLLLQSTVEHHAITMFHQEGTTPLRTVVELACKPAPYSRSNPIAMTQACQVAEHLALLRRRHLEAAEKVASIVNARDQDGMTVADVVVKYNARGSSNGYDLLRCLLQAGADPLLADPAGSTMLDRMQGNCSADMCQLVARHIGTLM